MLLPAFQKAPFCFLSGDTSLPCSTSISVGPTQPRCFQQTLIPLTRQFPLFFFGLVYPVSTPLPVFFTLLSHSSSSKRHKHAHTRAHKALILSLCGFSFKTESSQRKKVTPPPLLRAAGKLQPSSMPHPPLFSLFLSTRSFSLAHICTLCTGSRGHRPRPDNP